MQHPRKPQALNLAIGLALTAWPLSAALAQEAKPAEKNQLETVVITAERRVENIKDVPNAVSTLSGEKLEVLASGGEDLRFLSGRVPSLNIESSYGRAFPRFYIRGYGNTDFRLNASQPVSLIYDDVVQENPILKGFPVFDLRAVEVVAGPQGTLFGRNTPAGVVKFDSVLPSKKQDGYLSASYGSHGSTSVEGAFNLPLGGDWAARISAQVQHRDNWVKNQVPNAVTPETEGFDDRAVRIQALYAPSKDFSVLFNIHNRELDGSPRMFRASIIKPGTNELVDGFDPAKMYIDGKNEQRLHATGGSIKLKLNLGDVTLHSISAIETVQPFSRADVDGGYNVHLGPNFQLPPYAKEGDVFFPVETSDALTDHRQLTQEFRLESNGRGPLRWQGGVYLFDERYTMDQIDYFVPLPDGRVLTSQTNRAYAVFGSVNYDVTADFKLRAGLRYTQDKKSLAILAGAVNATAGTSAKTDDNKVNWDLSGTYALDKQTNLYARAATGFRAASIYPASAFGPQSQARPENVLSMEFGVKSDFWERRARLSASAFSYRVKDQQLTAVGSTSNTNTLLNASKATGQGFEVNLDLLPTDQLMLTLGASYNDTKLKDASLYDVRAGSGAVPIGMADSQGRYSLYNNPMPNAPKWIANVTARYSIPMSDGSEYFVYTDWAYRSKINFFLMRSVEFVGKPLLEGGLRVGYNWDNGKYEVAAFGRNITNKVVVNGAIAFNNLTGFINEPRSYGVQFKALF